LHRWCLCIASDTYLVRFAPYVDAPAGYAMSNLSESKVEVMWLREGMAD